MNIYKDTLYAVTPRAKIEYRIYVSDVPAREIEKYEIKDKLTALCRNGCANYEHKWSCPPFAPCYHEFTEKFENISVCLAFAYLDQFDYIKNDYLKIKAVHTILKSRMDKALRKLIGKDVYYISCGNCRLCKMCKCKTQGPCNHPDLMTYSFEALGINLAEMVKDLFDIPLLWYRKENLPDYTSVVAGLISKEKYDRSVIIKTLRSMN